MKTKLFAAGAALCMLGMTGCNKDMMEDTNMQVGQQITMDMQASGPQTRADYTDDGSTMNFSWSDGDAISVVVNGVAGNGNCRLITSTAGKSVPFSGKVVGWAEGGKTIYAFYPYNSIPYTVTGGDAPATATTLLTLPNPQMYTVGGAIGNSFMVGAGAATATNKTVNALASMKQVMSIVNLNITKAPGKVKGVKLSCTEAVFPTTATVTLSTAEVSASGTLANELSMTVTDNTTEATKVVSFAMFPADLSAKKIHIEITFEGDKSKIIEKDGTKFLRNMHYMMEFDGTLKPEPVGDVVLFAEGVSLESGWYDQNKSRVHDSELCWACTESNMIQWWQDRYVAAGKVLPPKAPNGIIPGRENEISRRLAVFEEFHMREFKNRGSAILRGIPQYFTTYYPEIFSDSKPFFSEGTYANSKVVRNLKEFSDFVVTGLKERGVVGLELLGHATTLWGATYNTETGLIKNIFMADSDDKHNGKFYHGIWEDLSIKERSDGRVVLGSGKLIEAVVVLYAYPGKTD
ncbi:IdeS/Mac family cysteine endopeptidase [Bacteroides fragilis]|nr:IdeS/Mac family cysteine endopeptidase [Bacteroides fragilis]MCE8678057.1 IdeS/Mac family cysteine endopeptidase [Bacteroides fragilis]